MAAAEEGTRNYYLDDFEDEIIPCQPTLAAWGEWLALPDEEWHRNAPASDGDVFTGHAILWSADIIATRTNGEWSLSRDPADDAFVAVRYGAGTGWSAEAIIYPEFKFVGRDFDLQPDETMAQALLRTLRAMDECCDDIEHVAVGTHEQGWRFTYSAPGVLQAERVQ